MCTYESLWVSAPASDGVRKGSNLYRDLWTKRMLMLSWCKRLFQASNTYVVGWCFFLIKLSACYLILRKHYLFFTYVSLIFVYCLIFLRFRLITWVFWTKCRRCFDIEASSKINSATAGQSRIFLSCVVALFFRTFNVYISFNFVFKILIVAKLIELEVWRQSTITERRWLEDLKKLW